VPRLPRPARGRMAERTDGIMEALGAVLIVGGLIGLLFLCILILCALGWRGSLEDPAPAWGGPRVHRIIYAPGYRTHLLTRREAYGLWHVFAEGDDRAIEWYENDRLIRRRE